MSTKQSAIAVVPHSNQRSPLPLLHLPLVNGSPHEQVWQTFPKNLSKLCFFIHTYMTSNITKYKLLWQELSNVVAYN